MENHILDSRAIGKSTAGFHIEDDRLIYLQRGLFNPFRFVVHEVELKELERAEARRSLFGIRVKIHKTNGECITIRGMRTKEAADLVGVLSRKNTKDSGSMEGASIRLISKDFGSRLNEILRDRTGCISRLVDLLIESAIELEASDIHIEPFDRIKVRFRIDGVLVDAAEIPFEYHSRLVSRIKVLAKAPTYEKDVPLDGRIEFVYSIRALICSVSESLGSAKRFSSSSGRLSLRRKGPSFLPVQATAEKPPRSIRPWKPFTKSSAIR
jgi:type II secretory ATPase GspE/PulE/Tfp pilus assembly ATPase PilB-like protein